MQANVPVLSRTAISNNQAMAEIGTSELRLARRGDAALLARMSRDYIEQGLPWRWQAPALNDKIAAAESVVLVADLELANMRFVGGFAVMDFPNDKAQLNLLAVHPNLRRHGIGNKLMRWLHKSARTAGVEHIELQVRADNLQARRFYHQLGYQEETLLPNYYAGKQAAYQMKLRLHND
jgi:ribosomal protein S18 acetylase RimI-like enzyme